MTNKEAKKIVNRLVREEYSTVMVRRWDIQIARNPWFSVGVHIDHTDPSITFHLPGVLVHMGRCKQPGFRFWNEKVVDAIIDSDK